MVTLWKRERERCLEVVSVSQGIQREESIVVNKSIVPFQDITFSSSDNIANDKPIKFDIRDIFVPSPDTLTFCFPKSPYCILKIKKK